MSTPRLNSVIRVVTGLVGLALVGGERQEAERRKQQKAQDALRKRIADLEGRIKQNLMAARVNYGFTTTMFLNALIQYNSDNKQWSSNVRFNIIHRPLSDIFVVYNERRDSMSGNLVDRALIAKMTYMFSR